MAINWSSIEPTSPVWHLHPPEEEVHTTQPLQIPLRPSGQGEILTSCYDPVLKPFQIPLRPPGQGETLTSCYSMTQSSKPLQIPIRLQDKVRF